MANGEILDNIWEESDHLWEQVWTVILETDPPQLTGGKRVDARQMLDGIIYRMRSGYQ